VGRRKVIAEGECVPCGGDVEIATGERQRDGWKWRALHGDDAVCLECGTAHMVVTNDDGQGWLTTTSGVTDAR
jgi:hypothetical protein